MRLGNRTIVSIYGSFPVFCSSISTNAAPLGLGPLVAERSTQMPSLWDSRGFLEYTQFVSQTQFG